MIHSGWTSLALRHLLHVHEVVEASLDVGLIGGAEQGDDREILQQDLVPTEGRFPNPAATGNSEGSPGRRTEARNHTGQARSEGTLEPKWSGSPGLRLPSSITLVGGLSQPRFRGVPGLSQVAWSRGQLGNCLNRTCLAGRCESGAFGGRWKRGAAVRRPILAEHRTSRKET